MQLIPIRVSAIVQTLGFVPVGESRIKPARLGGFTTLANHALAYRQLTREATVINGTPVCVTRNSRTEWTVSTSSGGTCALYTPLDQPIPGEVAGLWSEKQVKGKIAQTSIARYQIPFSATVTCLQDCPPAQ